jgi:hypothetical protein
VKTWEKWTTWAVAAVGASAGLWGAYTGQRALNLKQPLDEHTEMVKSYQGEIASASARRDLQTVMRLRRAYEEYEERWRDLQTLTALVAPLRELKVTRLSSAATSDLSELVGKLSMTPAVSNSAPATMGAAYLALNRFDSAAYEFSNAVADPKTLVLKAAAFSGLANSTTDSALKQRYEWTARNSLETSIKAASGTPESPAIGRFVQATPGLVELLPDTMAQKQVKPH